MNFDFSLFKNTAITEAARLQFRMEIFNLTNTPTFFLASASSTSPWDAKLRPALPGHAVGRQIQFGLKLMF